MTSATLIAIFRTLIIPPVSLLTLALIGYLIKSWYPRLGRTISSSALLILLLVSTNVGAWLLVAPLEDLEKPLISAKNTGAQAIVVLSAGTLENNPEYGNKAIPDYIALGRIRYAAKLYRETNLPILVSGGLGNKSLHLDSLATGMAQALTNEFAIPVRWQEDQSQNTRENAEFSANILKQAGIKHILLVTDAMHMRRAKFAFDQTGLEVTCAPTVFFSRGGLSVFSLLPSVEGLRRSQYAMHEWMGLIWYRLSN